MWIEVDSRLLADLMNKSWNDKFAHAVVGSHGGEEIGIAFFEAAAVFEIVFKEFDQAGVQGYHTVFFPFARSNA